MSATSSCAGARVFAPRAATAVVQQRRIGVPSLRQRSARSTNIVAGSKVEVAEVSAEPTVVALITTSACPFCKRAKAAGSHK